MKVEKDLRNALFDYRMQKRFDLIVGGDFNTVANLGPHGDLPNEMMAMFGFASCK